MEQHNPGEQQQQEQVDPHNHEDRLPLPPANPDMELLFRLSDEERQCALDLKAAVEASPDVQHISDLHYAQYAINNFEARGDIPHMLEHLQGLQAFREEYNINDTHAEGMAIISGFTRKFPGALLSVAYDDEKECYGLIYDRTRFFSSNLVSADDWRITLGAMYYHFHAFYPDPYSMRQGMFVIAECEGMESSGTAHFLSLIQRMWYHLLINYPFKLASTKYYHTSMAANMSFALLKPFMPRSITDRFELGCQFGVNIASLYLLPTLELANQKYLNRIDSFLKRRYEYEAIYKLD